MAYLVDGNNLLAQTPGLSMNEPSDRRRFVSSLAQFSRTRRCKVTVFFDGLPLQGWGSTTHLGAVTVLHSGRGRTADDAILEMIRRSRAPGDLTLVTSDRSLYERARHLGARAEAGHAFRRTLGRAGAKEAGDSEKPERPDQEEIDYFMERFGEAAPPDSKDSSRRR